MTTLQLQNKIVAMYDEDDENFAAKANKIINNYYAGLKPSKSTSDPTRLGSRSVFTSRLRSALREKAGPMDVDTPAADRGTALSTTPFNKMTVEDQLKFQARSIKLGANTWVHSVEIAPKNIAQVGMSPKERQVLWIHRIQVDKAKLKAEAVEVDCSAIMERLGPALSDPDAKKQEIAAALLLVTGRRTAEILKTGSFHLNDGQTSDGYEAVFSGQCKAGLDDKP